MNDQSKSFSEKAIKSQHQTIIEGGRIEQFAEALGRFCQFEGWKKLKDEDGVSFKSLRHYIEAEPPFGAGYPGKDGMEKIEAYLALNPRVKDYFQLCHANCIFELAEEEGVTPSILSKRIWNDTKGARLAKMISVDENREQIFEEMAVPYLENKQRVARKPRPVNPTSSVRIRFKPEYPYALAQKVKESLSEKEIELLIVALKDENIDQSVEFERLFHLALNAFNLSKSKSGWGAKPEFAPEAVLNRQPCIKHSHLTIGKKNGTKSLSLSDKNGEIVLVRFSGTGPGVSTLAF